MKQSAAKGTLVDPLTNALGYQLRRASVLIMSDLHTRLESLKLTITMASTLMVISENTGAKLIEIGQCLEVKRANITPIINDLEKRELLERIIAGRSHALTLTQKGIAIVSEIRQAITASEQHYFGHLDDSARHHLQSILISIRSQNGEK